VATHTRDAKTLELIVRHGEGREMTRIVGFTECRPETRYQFKVAKMVPHRFLEGTFLETRSLRQDQC